MHHSIPASEYRIRKPRRRWWKRILFGVLLAVLILTGVYRYRAWRLDRELDEVVAELDQSDPGWRLEDIEKNRRVLRDEENAALVIQAVIRQIPARWIVNPFWDDTTPPRPNVRPPAEKL